MNYSWKEKLLSLQGSLPEGDAITEDNQKPEPEKPRLDIYFEKKGRGEKQATIVTGFTCDDDELKKVAATLKQQLGTGGSARGGEILIQGDRRNALPDLLLKLGYKSRII